MSGSTMFWRLMWKEYRQFRGFGLAMMCLGFVFLLLAIQLGNRTYNPFLASNAIFFSILFVAGCAATTFAMERENNTYLLQRMLPVSVWQVVSAKISLTLIGAAVIFVVLASATFLIGGPNQFNFEWQEFLFYGLVLLEFLAWGTLFSLIDYRPLRALALAITCALFCLIAAATISMWVHGTQGLAPTTDLTGLIVRVTVLVAVTIVDVWLAKRWFQEGAKSTWLSISLRPLVWQVRIRTITWTLSGWPGTLTHLLWLQRRLMIWPLLALGTIMIVGRVLIAADPLNDDAVGEVLLFGGIATFIGALAIAPAGKEREFLAQHGVRGVWLWVAQMSRPLLLCLFVAVCIWPTLSAGERHYPSWKALTTICLFTGFAYGQWGSQISKSSLSAIGTAFILGSLAISWVALMEWLSVSRWLCVYPMILAPLVITCLHSGRWLLNQRQSVAAHLATGFVFAAILTAFVCFRMFEVPAVDQQELARLFPIREPKNPAVVKRFREIGDVLKVVEKDPKGWGSAQQKDKWLQIVLDSDFDFRLSELPDLQVEDESRMRRIFTFLFTSLTDAIDEGRVDDGARLLRKLSSLFEHQTGFNWNYAQIYMRWASMPGNTSERILEIRKLHARQSTNQLERIRNNFGLQRRLLHAAIDGDAEFLNGENPWYVGPDSAKIRYFQSLSKFAFWEKIRQHKLLDRRAINSLKDAELIEQQINKQIPPTIPLTNPSKKDAFDDDQLLLTVWRQLAGDDMSGFYYIVEQNRRYLQLQLALKAWQIDHDGRLPFELEKLVGKYLDRVPNDVYTGKRFYYFPAGIDPAPVIAEGSPYAEYLIGESKDSTKPFLWSSWPGAFEPNHFRLKVNSLDLNWGEIKSGQIIVIE